MVSFIFGSVWLLSVVQTTLDGLYHGVRAGCGARCFLCGLAMPVTMDGTLRNSQHRRNCEWVDLKTSSHHHTGLTGQREGEGPSHLAGWKSGTTSRRKEWLCGQTERLQGRICSGR